MIIFYSSGNSLDLQQWILDLPGKKTQVTASRMSMHMGAPNWHESPDMFHQRTLQWDSGHQVLSWCPGIQVHQATPQYSQCLLFQVMG